MEILNRREQIGAKKLPPVIGEDVEKAGKSKYGVVKIGDGINVNNGVISVSAPAAAVVIDVGEYSIEDGYSSLSSDTLSALNAAIAAGNIIIFNAHFAGTLTVFCMNYTLEELTENEVTTHYIYIPFGLANEDFNSVSYNLETGNVE